MSKLVKLLGAAAFLLGPALTLAAVDARSIPGTSPGVWHLNVTGEITAQDALTVAAWRRQYGRIQSASLESAGGDVRAAMQIGRMLRTDLAEGTANRCASACVLVYLGLVSRPYLHDGNLAIHRAIGLQAAATYAQEKTLVDQRNIWIGGYLKEMNISPRLLDAMNEVPSYKIRYLTQSEAESFGISEYDPVYLEQRQGAIAKKLGVGMLEAQRRTIALIRQCDALSNGERSDPSYSARTSCIRSIGLM
jgi:hypothetical protein